MTPELATCYPSGVSDNNREGPIPAATDERNERGEPDTRLEDIELDEPSDSAREARALSELPQVFGDKDNAFMLLDRAGFSRAARPPFNKPDTFWHRVITEIRSGKRPGVRKLLQEAAKLYPLNEAFDRAVEYYASHSDSAKELGPRAEQAGERPSGGSSGESISATAASGNSGLSLNEAPAEAPVLPRVQSRDNPTPIRGHSLAKRRISALKSFLFLLGIFLFLGLGAFISMAFDGGRDEDHDTHNDSGIIDQEDEAIAEDGFYYADEDGDGFPDPTDREHVHEAPDSYMAVRTDGRWDCMDTDERVHPGQTMFFTSPRADGSFDFDCNGIQELQFASQSRGRCGGTPYRGFGCLADPTGWIGGNRPRCGEIRRWLDDCDITGFPPSCSHLESTERRQGCR